MSSRPNRESRTAGPEPPGPRWASSALIETAAALADHIRDRAVRLKDGSLVWPGPSPSAPGSGAPTMLGPDLYSGTTGIAFFLAALARVGGSDASRGLSLEVLAPTRRFYAGLAQAARGAGAPGLLIGGLTGLGSLIYAFARIGQWLEVPALIREAHELTTLLTPERIEMDGELDVTGGSAGAILALLALEALRPEPNSDGVSPLDLAAACGHHLLGHRTSHHGRPRAWSCPPDPGLSGFAHGAAGICYALLRLYHRSGDPRLLAAAQEGLAFERTLYDAEQGNWRDLRHSEVRFQTSWCHGAPGIALARVGALDVLSDDEVLSEIRQGLDTTRSLPNTPVDHLCCGNMGRAEILLFAHQKLGERPLLAAAQELADRVLGRAERRGSFGYSEDDPSAHLTLFRGAAGIGFSLLRLAAPASLACPLLLE